MSSETELVKSIASNLSHVEGEVGRAVLDKVEKVLNKNSGYDIMYKIADVLSGRKYSINEELENSNICFLSMPLCPQSMLNEASNLKICKRCL